MTVRVRYKIELTVSSTSAEEKDLGNQSLNVVSDGMGKGGVWKTVILAAGSDVQVSLDNIANAKLLFLRTSPVDPTQLPGTITAKRNLNTGEAWPIVPLPATNTTPVREGVLLLSTSGLTALFLSNPGTVDMNVVVGVGGDT